MPSDLPLRPYDSPRAGGGGSGGSKRPADKGTVLVTSTDGAFLDFLYPPQALAWAKRMSGLQREQRNAKRLPEGFAQPSRGYASRAREEVVGGGSSQAGQPGGSQRNQETNESHDVHGDRTSGEFAQVAGKRRVKRHLEEDLLVAGRTRLAQSVVAELSDHCSDTDGARRIKDTVRADAIPLDYGGSDFADSPGDLAEAETDVIERLHGMLAQRRRDAHEDPANQLAATQRVLEAYDTLDITRKDDVRLKGEMMSWLSLQCNSEADVRCAELCHSLPLEHRTASLYQAALAVFLRRGLHVHAVRLHREALKNIPNGVQVTKSFFEYAVKEQRWQLAMNIEAQYRLQNSRGEAGQQLFWLHVSEMPRLIRLALDLAKHVRALAKARTINEEVQRFCGHFYAEALVQEFQTNNANVIEAAFDAKGIPKGSIGRLFEHLHHLGDDAPRFYERMILSLVDQKRAVYQYPQVHRLVSYAYLRLHKMEHRISESVLMALLKALIRYWGRNRVQTETHHSVNIFALTADWRRYHGTVSKAAMQQLLSWHAGCGRQGSFKSALRYYKKHYPTYEDQKSVLADAIYLHARRCDLEKAQAAFDEAIELTAQHDEAPPLICWNVLIHAYSRSDNLEGGLDRLQALIDKGLKPDEFSFHPITEMLAKRGDVESVKDMLAQYDTLAQKKREVAFTGSLLTAHVNCDEIEKAEVLLGDSIKEVKTGNVRGSLTGSFNIILTGHALRRDIEATMRTYRWMKAEGIRMDADTYAALMQALTTHGQTDAAYKILRVVMRDKLLEPTAFHYALVMTGYVNEGHFDIALKVHKVMRDRNIRPTVSSNVIYMKARALEERAKVGNFNGQDHDAAPLKQTMNDMRVLLIRSTGKELAPKQPGLGHGLGLSATATPAAYVSYLIYVHGRRQCFAAVKRIYSDYQEKLRKLGQADAQAPIPLLTALMTANLQAKEYEEVERCWQLARDQADELAKVVPVSQLKPAVAQEGPEQDVMQLQAPKSDDAEEAGFQVYGAITTDNQSSTEESPPPTQALEAQVSEGSYQPSAPKLSPARRHILSRPLRYYLYSLSAQGRIAEMLSTVRKCLSHGYIFDNRTWNVFIQLLCQASPPLVLLAFTLTERFLIPHFQGWMRDSNPGAWPSSLEARPEGLQYIRARYLRPGQLMPQYRTMVVLASALLHLRRTQASGRRGTNWSEPAAGMEKYVGTVRQLLQKAPKTVLAVQRMPAVDDALQNRLLRRR